MIDVRAISVLDVTPESIKSDPEIIALSRALDTELHAVAMAIIEANILPRIDELDDPVLDEIAWAVRLNELQLWDNATTAAKRTLLKNIFAILKKSGTRYSIRRIFDVMSVVGTVVEWWEEAQTPNTYRLRLFVDDVGVSLQQQLEITELVLRFGRASQKLREFAIESNRTALLTLAAAPEAGIHITVDFSP